MIGRRVLFGLVICGVALYSLAGCTTATSTNDTWVVFPEHRAEEMNMGTWLSADSEVEGYWTPTEEEVLLLEDELPAFLQENSASFRRQPPVWEHLDSYKRQYAGVVLNGKKIIYGNFFCSDTGLDWKKDWIFVLDGGDCFFQLQFDPASGIFSGLTVNGEA